MTGNKYYSAPSGEKGRMMEYRITFDFFGTAKCISFVADSEGEAVEMFELSKYGSFNLDCPILGIDEVEE